MKLRDYYVVSASGDVIVHIDAYQYEGETQEQVLERAEEAQARHPGSVIEEC